MRQIENKDNANKKKQRNQIIVGLLLIGLMLLSTAGYAAFNTSGTSSQTFKYNKLKFENVNGYWQTTFNSVNYFFLYKPTEVKERELVVNPLSDYKDKPLYIQAVNFDAEKEVSRDLYYISSSIKEACLKGKNCTNSDLPVKTCEDNFIIIEEGEEGITQQNNCVFIKGKYESLTLLTDEFLYKLLGIV